MTMIHEILETGPLQVNCQLVGNRATGAAVVIDPGGHVETILRRLSHHNLRLTHILATHAHFDHIGGAAELQERTTTPFWFCKKDEFLLNGAKEHAASWGLPFGNIPRVDRGLVDGDQLEFDGFTMEVIHTPGHSPGGICLRWDDQLAVGDTIFAGSIGRTDLPGGDYDQLITGVRNSLFALPDNYVCHPGHGPSTTIGRERRSNPFFAR